MFIASSSTESLGAVRQELRVSDLAAGMVEYLGVLTEKYGRLHDNLVEARGLIDTHHIVIERAKEVPTKVLRSTDITTGVSQAVSRSRSVSLACPPCTDRIEVAGRDSVVRQVRP